MKSTIPFLSKLTQKLGSGDKLNAFLDTELEKNPVHETKFGFTKDRENYTHSTAILDDRGRPVWAVVPLPRSWQCFGRPARRYGEDGMMGRYFYPLRVLHGLKV